MCLIMYRAVGFTNSCNSSDWEMSVCNGDGDGGREGEAKLENPHRTHHRLMDALC